MSGKGKLWLWVGSARNGESEWDGFFLYPFGWEAHWIHLIQSFPNTPLIIPCIKHFLSQLSLFVPQNPPDAHSNHNNVQIWQVWRGFHCITGKSEWRIRIRSSNPYLKKILWEITCEKLCIQWSPLRFFRNFHRFILLFITLK